MRVEEDAFLLVNLQFAHLPDDFEKSKQQIEKLLAWLDQQPAEMPVVVCGDFGNEPDSPPVKEMRKYFDSAYNQVHGEEPEYTFPTPLPHSWRLQLKDKVDHLLGKASPEEVEERMCLDYIFVDPRLNTMECRIVFDKPESETSNLYPSKHLGLFAEIEIF